MIVKFIKKVIKIVSHKLDEYNDYFNALFVLGQAIEL